MEVPCCIVRQGTVQFVCLCVSLMHASTYKISRFGRWGKDSSGSDVSTLFPKFLLKIERVKIIWCLSAMFKSCATVLNLGVTCSSTGHVQHN